MGLRDDSLSRMEFVPRLSLQSKVRSEKKSEVRSRARVDTPPSKNVNADVTLLTFLLSIRT